MPKKKLDLLELASRIMAEPRTGPPKIMGRETWNVFLKCCVLTVCRPDKHTEIADHFRYRLRLTTHQASLSPSSGRNGSEWRPLPMRSAIAQRSSDTAGFPESVPQVRDVAVRNRAE